MEIRGEEEATEAVSRTQRLRVECDSRGKRVQRHAYIYVSAEGKEWKFLGQLGSAALRVWGVVSCVGAAFQQGNGCIMEWLLGVVYTAKVNGGQRRALIKLDFIVFNTLKTLFVGVEQ